MMHSHGAGLVALAAATSLLAACGGGGGGDAVTGARALAVVTSENAPAIANSAASGATTATQAGSSSGGVNTGGGTAERRAATLAAKAEVQIGPITEPCFISGSATVSADIQGQPFVAGDTLSISFANCVDEPGITLNGGFSATISAFAGSLDTELFLLGMDATFNGFAVTEDGITATANGQADILFDSLSFPVLDATIGGEQTTFSDGSETLTFRDYELLLTEDLGLTPARNTLDGAGRITSNQYSGDVLFDITVPFVQLATEDYPFEGEMLITGKDGATIRLIVLDAVNVQLEIDLDGDGTLDEVRQLTWVELEQA